MRYTNCAIIFVLLLFVSVDYLIAQNICLTPRNTEGLCIPLQQCPSLHELLQRKPVRTEDTNYLREATCGFEGTAPKVCCDSQAPVPTSPSTPITSCRTPNGISGACVIIDNCPQLLNILKHPPLSQDNVNLLRQSQCGAEGRRPRVCCSQQQIELSTQPPVYTTTTEKINIDTGTGAIPNSQLLPQLGQCGEEGLGDRIVGGEAADIDEFPWMALLEYSEKGFGCGGVLISPKYVLSAAHCMKGEVFQALGVLISVRLGEYHIRNDTDCVLKSGGYQKCNEPPQDIDVEQYMAHPGWVQGDRNHYNDIGIVRLKQNAVESAFVKPVCVPNVHMRPNVGEMVHVAGWGRTETGFSSAIKLKLQVPVVSQERCSVPYAKQPYGVSLIHDQICAGGEDQKDSCRGDSGGPLLKYDRKYDSWFVVGVVSFGPDPCGQKDFPGIYTSVPQYVKWILKNMRP